MVQDAKTTHIAWLCGFALVIIFLLPGYTAGGENEVSPESIVVFNTVCAKCHEAECSGRLTFIADSESSSSHIVRHYGRALGKRWLQMELFTILEYMKKKCAYYPMVAALPPDRRWGSETLREMGIPPEYNYFVPLGALDIGKYRMQLLLTGDTKVSAQLVSETFDMAVDDCYESERKKITIYFSIPDGEKYYFRMYPRRPVQLSEIFLESLEK